jgi:hypothetical protein
MKHLKLFENYNYENINENLSNKKSTELKDNFLNDENAVRVRN